MSVWKKAALAGGVGVIGLAFAAQTFAQGGQRAGHMGHERPAFTAFDANSDGQISVEEVKAYSVARFAQHDANGDGVLDREELLAMAAARAAERAETHIDRMLTWQDDDGDGALSASELPDNRMGHMFERMDRDDDGMVSEEEYAQAMEHGNKRHGKKGGHGGQGGGHGADSN